MLLMCVMSSCVQEEMGPCEQAKPEEDGVTLTLVIPTRAFHQAAAAQATNEEEMMSDIYLVAVSASDASNVTWIPLTSAMYVGKDDDYDVYKVKLDPGSYRFYTFANFDSYQSTVNWYESVDTETKIKDLSLDFTQVKLIVPPYLPMACVAENIQFKKGEEGTKRQVLEAEKYAVEISKDEDTRIYADMTFLCSKVRYTLLFNDTPDGFSSEFGNYSIRFDLPDHLPYVSNARKKTYLYAGHDLSAADGNDLFMDDEDIELNRFNWNVAEGEDYPKGPASMLTSWEGTDENWQALRQRVWQGVIYLPENITIGIARSQLNFPYKIDLYSDNYDNENYTESEYGNQKKSMLMFANGDETHYGESGDQYNSTALADPSSGLKRGYFYDLVAKVKTPDEIDLKFEFYYQIMEWHYVDENVTEDSSLAKIPTGLYLVGTFNEWFFRDEYEMIETPDGRWRSKERVSLPNNCQLRIRDYKKNTDLGKASSSSIMNNTGFAYGLTSGSNTNMQVTFGYTYNGYVYLKLMEPGDYDYWNTDWEYEIWVGN